MSGNFAHPASKVTISPVGDPARGTDALIVTIKTVDAPPPSVFKPLPVKNTKRIPKGNSPAKLVSDRTVKNSTMSDKSKDSSQVGHASSEGHSTPCIRHAAENISRKASDIPSEKVSLCNNCSKSMLSYIFVVQDFLDSLAKEICGNADPKRCVQCEREALRSNLSSSSSRDEIPRRDRNTDSISSPKSSSERTGDRQSTENSRYAESSESSGKRTSRTKSHRKRDDGNRGATRSIGQETYSHQETQQVDFLYNVSSSQGSPTSSNKGSSEQSRTSNETVEHRNIQSNHDHGQVAHHQRNEGTAEDTEQGNWYDNQRHQRYDVQQTQASPRPAGEYQPSSHGQYSSPSDHQASEFKNQAFSSGPGGHHGEGGAVFRKPMERSQPNQELSFPTHNQEQSFSASSQQTGHGDFPGEQNAPSLYEENVDGIVSTLSHVEREVYDTARNRAGWESLTESQERLGSSPSGQISSEAFVTSCRNNAEAMGCLVLGTSLLLTRTSRTLCVLVSDGVSNAFRGPLSAIFNVVQYVRAMDSLGTTKLALLEQPELGISFDKLNIWRLSQFSKCVYINPDALVIQNCDELFSREELSAVPDIGWPDCFNSGVFVFVPSGNTFWQLLEFAEKQGSYDGGDQGLLNSFFNFWSHDINRKLSFIYNLMANVSYTYTPAFTQFGRNVKIVQFHGSFKPWHVKFFSATGQIAPASTVHPTYVQFVHIWLNIFRISVLRMLSQEIQSYASSQKVICAIELLRFFPLPSESEAEFYLTPPSVRVRLAEKRLQRVTTPISEAQRRKSAEFPRPAPPEKDETPPPATSTVGHAPKDQSASSKIKTEDPLPKDQSATPDIEKTTEGATENTDDAESPRKVKVKDENAIPGSEVGDYQGMKAWEQGRMDYQGTDSSENIIKRLEFLMSRNK